MTVDERPQRQGFRYQRLLFAVIALIVVLVSLVMLINYLPNASGSASRSRASNTLNETTNVEVFTYDVTDDMVRTALQLGVTLDAGSAAWTFTDPTGAVVWQGALATGQRINETRQFDPVVGQWRLELDVQNAVGDYAILWRGLD